MKKKILKIFVIVFIAWGAFTITPSIHAKTIEYSNLNNTQLGKSIDVIKSKSIDATQTKKGVYIFNQNWLNSLNVDVDSEIRKSVGFTASGLSISELISDINIKEGFHTATNATVDILTLGAKFGYLNNATFSHSEYSSQYYFYKSFYYIKSIESLPGYRQNLELYKNNLHPDFLNDLTRLNNGSMTYNQFFNLYGTHVIGSAQYGGKLEVYNSILSNQVVFNQQIKTDLTNSFSVGLQYIGTQNTTINIGLNTSGQVNTSNSFANLRITALGGKAFDINNQSEFQSNHNEWLNSLNASVGSLINIDNDGFIPFWDLIPSNFSSVKANMKYQYEVYANNEKNSSSDFFSCNKFNNQTYSTELKYIRSTKYRIPDKPQYQNLYDAINLNQFGLSFGIMKYNNFKTVNFKVYITIYEEDDGYQHIFLYKSLINSSSELLAQTNIEHGPGFRNKNPIVYTFEWKNISINHFDDVMNEFYIRYCASGTNYDYWFNYDLNVSLTFNK